MGLGFRPWQRKMCTYHMTRKGMGLGKELALLTIYIGMCVYFFLNMWGHGHDFSEGVCVCVYVCQSQAEVQDMLEVASTPRLTSHSS